MRWSSLSLMTAMVAWYAVSCSEPKNMHRKIDVSGTYIGRYFDGIEEIEVRADGTFHQVFTRDGVQLYAQSGKWGLAGDGIGFRPFCSCLMAWGKSTGPSYEKVQVANAILRRNPLRIEFGEWPYTAVKK